MPTPLLPALVTRALLGMSAPMPLNQPSVQLEHIPLAEPPLALLVLLVHTKLPLASRPAPPALLVMSALTQLLPLCHAAPEPSLLEV